MLQGVTQDPDAASLLFGFFNLLFGPFKGLCYGLPHETLSCFNALVVLSVTLWGAEITYVHLI